MYMIKKIKNFIIIVLLISLISVQGNAAIVDITSAKHVGLNYWYAYSPVKEKNINDIQIKQTYIVNENSEPVYYVFNIAGGGFVIVSAEDAVMPILGYSYEGEFLIDNQPEVIAEWMSNYTKQILSAKQKNIKPTDEINQNWQHYYNNNVKLNNPKSDVKGVLPLIKTKWDQGLNYNFHCPPHPAGPGGKCYAGCTATAMAQVMKYWNYPEHGYGSNSYYHPYYGTISLNFSTQQYDWAQMTNIINSASRESISTLIYNCGVSVNMYYTPNGSSSSTSYAKDALRNNFHYRLNIQYVQKEDYDSIEWVSLLMDNLDEGMPILYSGSGSAGGHSFVCDGYNDLNYFHFNWGWSGANDGYFLLNNLNSGNGDFTADQSAVINIIPYDAPYCKENRLYTKHSAVITDGSGYSMYWNNTHCSWLINPTGATEITIKFNSLSTEEGKDIIYIYDGNSNNAPLLGAFSGNSLPPIITTTGGKAFIEFITDDINTYQGWELKYTTNLTDIEENNNPVNNYNIYPNPVKNIATIDFVSAIPEYYQLNIYNITGGLIANYFIPKGTSQYILNTDMLPQGAFIVSVVSNKGYYLNKIIVK